ncbi:uncharacterized protein E0L32_007845 [Thyridium curvatum]|uniref:Metallothionein n=1 Tax=Thyridium curvatum TaxID=1093900 RepID=A0A507AXF2_9PEZI|nr:uncharacterized protein E0L32_007845 [Thyridium curvatum]TPX11426.1 hypothetical protein E0L32_007845 [Thyridium curvatum]
MPSSDSNKPSGNTGSGGSTDNTVKDQPKPNPPMDSTAASRGGSGGGASEWVHKNVNCTCVTDKCDCCESLCHR